MSNLQDAIEFITAQRDLAKRNVIHHHLLAAAPDLDNNSAMRDDSIEDRDGFNNCLAVLATITPKPQTWQEDHG